jgi:hypothetical protein
MLLIPSYTANWPADPPGKRTGRLVALLLLVVSLTASVLIAVPAAPASAATACDPGSDTCVVSPDTVQTPLGPVTVTVSAANVVTVQLTPTGAGTTVVFGIPFTFPPGPPSLPGYARTIVTTAGGEVDIDTLLTPPSRFALPNLAIVSIHPPGPCHVRTSGTTVIFTPIFPPGPPT